MYKLLVTILLFPITTFAADYTFTYDQHCRKAYQLYTSLQLAEGNAAIRQAVKENPYNLMATYIADYEDCLLLLFNGDKTDMEQRRAHFSARIDLLNRGNENDPWFRLCKAGVYLHWALVYVRFEENLKAAAALRKSFLLLKENRRMFPQFEYNDIFFGLEEAIIGTIPDEYKWIASIFGMKGDVKKGVGKLERFIKTHNAGDILRNEAVAYYCYLKFYLLSKQEEVWSFIASDQFSTDNNLLNLFVKANLALNYRKADVALQTLRKAQEERGYNRFPIFDYELASALYFKLDPGALSVFQQFLADYKGNIFVKETWLRMANMHYLRQRMQQADYCRGQIKRNGTLMVDADKQAQRFSENTGWPDKILLQARLLTDGGYYKQALAKIHIADVSRFTIAEKLEYNFRLGRIYDELNDDRAALNHYQAAIALGSNRPEHFAARSALQMAFIYERQGKIKEAIAKYQQCLAMRGHDYQNSIDQQAKAGLNRLQG